MVRENAVIFKIRPVTPEVASSSLVAPATKKIRGLGHILNPFFYCPVLACFNPNPVLLCETDAHICDLTDATFPVRPAERSFR